MESWYCRYDCKQLYVWNSYEKYYMWNLSTCDSECNNACKIDEYIDIKNCSWKKRLFGKLACETGIPNTIETSANDKKVTYETNNCLFYTVLLVNIFLWLVLVVLFIIQEIGYSVPYYYRMNSLKVINKNNSLYFWKKFTKNVNIKFTKCQNYNGEHSITK